MVQGVYNHAFPPCSHQHMLNFSIFATLTVDLHHFHLDDKLSIDFTSRESLRDSLSDLNK